jgi:hypothetical protein
LLSIYLLLIGKEVSIWVGGETKIVVASPQQSQSESSAYIANLEQRLAEYESKINQIFLDCADTSIRVDQLEESIEQFKQAALALHREQIDRLESGLEIIDLLQTHPYLKLPKGSPVMLGAQGFSIEHDPEKLKEHQEKILARTQLLESTLMHKKCHSCDEYEYFIKVLHSGEKRPSFNCPHCNPNVISAKASQFRKKDETGWTEVKSSGEGVPEIP